ncbi:hypothetical protein TL16_g02265 [Triparma laevis f. inornata]|uniref:U-box domain-containing protein n=1 Tax=Triparma laevis f. inornata TaxID=1714386 RepID=A0A9W7E009_9STRA|nr:hypothetical protein TL16_g02265 [Triparma laevis f. inornata]
MTNPVILTCDGITYERSAIETWISEANSEVKLLGGKIVTPSGVKMGQEPDLVVNVSMVEAIEKAGLGPTRGSRSVSGGNRRNYKQCDNIIVPLCAFNSIQSAARRKNSREIDLEITKAKEQGITKDKKIQGISRKAYKNLTEGQGVENHHNSMTQNIEQLEKRVSDTRIEVLGEERVMKELSKSGRHVTTTWLNHGLECCMIGGSVDKRGSSLYTAGCFTGFEINSETVLTEKPTSAPKKLLSLAGAGDFPDYLVTAGQEKGIRVWRFIENEEEGGGDDTVREFVEESKAEEVGGGGKKRSSSFFGSLFKKGKEEKTPPRQLIVEAGENGMGRWVESAYIDVTSTSNDWINCLKMSASGSTIFAADRKGTLSIFRNGLENNPVGGGVEE